MKLQKPGGTQGHFLSIRKSICKDNSYTRDSIIKRVLVRKKVEFLFTVSFFVLFQVSRKNVQAVSILLYFLMYFLCLVLSCSSNGFRALGFFCAGFMNQPVCYSLGQAHPPNTVQSINQRKHKRQERHRLMGTRR